MRCPKLSCQAVVSVCLLIVPAAALATDLPTYIASDTTLTAAAAPYHITANTTVAADATVTVEAGVTVIADGDYQLRVEGTLLAAGSEAALVVFRPLDNEAMGAWQGLFFTDSGRGELEHAIVRGAKTNLTAAGGYLRMENSYSERAQNDGLFVFGDAYIRIVGCYFLDNGRRGLYIESTDPGGSIWRSYFLGNGEYPVYTKATCAEMLKRGNRYAANAIQRVGVSCSALEDITDTDTWYDQDGLAYDLSAGAGSSELAISGTLRIEPGVTIGGADIDVTGCLEAAGSSEQPITITALGASQAPGDWSGLNLRAGARADFSHLIVRYAENAIIADGATLSLAASSISQQLYDGVRCLGDTCLDIRDTTFDLNQRDALRIEGWDAASPGVTNCRFCNSGRYPVYACAGAVRLLGANNVYQGNAEQKIAVACHNSPDLVQGVHNWLPQGVPLDLTARPDGIMLDIGSSATLNIPAGVKVLGGGITVNGQLNVQAVLATPAYFDGPGASPQPGDWEGISFKSGATGTLKGADICNATHGIQVVSAAPRLEQCYITASQYDGLRFTGNAAPVIYQTWVVNNGHFGIYIGDSAQPNLGNTDNADTSDDGLNHIHDNGSYQVYNATANDIYIQNNWWDTTAPAAVLAGTYDRNDNPAVGSLLLGQLRSYGLGGVEASSGPVNPALTVTCASAESLAGGAVQINYRVSAASDVRIVISNIAGRPIAQLDQQALPDRMMTLLWNGRSYRGTRVPLGRYLCILCAHAEDGQSSRVMIPLNR